MKFSIASAFLFSAHFRQAGAALTNRGLMSAALEGYQPVTDVSDEAIIDHDQAEIDRQLTLATPGSFLSAAEIYRKGAFSSPMAEVVLDEDLPSAISGNSVVTGTSVGSTAIAGVLLEDYAAGERNLMIAYSNGTECSVGGLPDPQTSDCFADSGTLSVGDLVLPYTYDKVVGNVNGRTLQGFSLNAEETYGNYPDFKKFIAYYGRADYGDNWIENAFIGGVTDFDRGNADFSTYTSVGRAECVKKGTVYLNVWMQVLGEMEKSLESCDLSEQGVASWDRAVAYYVGSLEGAGGELPGNLVYLLANKRCKNFKTCGENGDESSGTAKANLLIMDLFDQGQINIQEFKCSEARANKELIVQKMTIPLVQGALRYNYISDYELDAGEKVEAEGVIFAAAVLPFLHHCNPDDAKTVYENSMIGFENEIFADVKAAVENNYECLGVTCEDVGGLYDDDIGGYLTGAEPCGTSGATAMGLGIATSLIVAGLGLFM